MNQITTLSKIPGVVDAAVSMDDIVNVFVSKFEEELYSRRGSVQQSVKNNTAEKNKLKELIQSEVADSVKGMFTKTVLAPGVVVNYKIKAGNEGDLDKSTKWPVSVESHVAIDSEAISFADHSSKTVSMNILVAVNPDHIEHWKQLTNTMNQLKEQLVVLNSEIQGVDRKTRQVKGLIAGQKLADAGMENLLGNEEIAKILALPTA